MGKTNIECPFCKKVFVTPKKRHYYATKVSRGRFSSDFEGTLCGIKLRRKHSFDELIVKPGEEVNCKQCIRYRKLEG